MSRGQLPTFRRAQACTTNDTGPHNIYIYICIMEARYIVTYLHENPILHIEP